MILDVVKLSKKILESIGKVVSNKKFVIFSGSNFSSQVYVKMKLKRCQEHGIKVGQVLIEENMTQLEVEQLVKAAANDSNVGAIMIQHPLPEKFDETKLFNLIPEKKDVDGLSAASLGLILQKSEHFVPATAKGIMTLLEEYHIDLEGRSALVIGRSQIVGKPLAAMLTNKNASVMLAHSKTKNLKELAQQFDIVVAAVGKPNFVKADWLKDGVILIDAGYNDNNTGDVDPSAYKKASFFTPVPGGVGPMTICSLICQVKAALE